MHLLAFIVDWNRVELEEGVAISLLFLLVPMGITALVKHRKQQAHNEWMAQSVYELHLKQDGRPPSTEHPHYALGAPTEATKL